MFRTVLIVGLLVLLSVSLLAAGYAGFLVYVPKIITTSIETTQQSGYPTTLEALDAWYKQPEDGRNAADLYAKAFALDTLSETTASANALPFVSETLLPRIGAPVSDSDRAAMAAYLTAKADTLKALHEATSISTCRFPVHATDPDNIELPQLEGLRRATQLLALEALACAESQQANNAVAALVAGYSAAVSIREEPLLISQLARATYVSTMMDALERVVNRIPLDNVQLSQLLNAVALAEAPHAFERAFAGERVLGIAGLPDDSVGVREDGSVALSGRVYALLGLRQLDTWTYLAFLHDLVAAAEMPLHQRREAYAEWIARVDSLTEILPLSKKVLTEFSKATTVDLRTAAMLRVARTAIAVQQYRVNTQNLPDNLETLVPQYLEAIPGDPFAPAPVRFKKGGMQAMVTSLGPNGIPDTGESTDDDIVFTVQR